jgi:hypothetical protein
MVLEERNKIQNNLVKVLKDPQAMNVPSLITPVSIPLTQDSKLCNLHNLLYSF